MQINQRKSEKETEGNGKETVEKKKRWSKMFSKNDCDEIDFKKWL